MADRNTKIRASQIKDDDIFPIDIASTNAVSIDGYIMEYDSLTGKYTWVAPSSGGVGVNDVDDFTIKYENSELKIADRIELNIMLNAFRIAIEGSLTQFAMTDGISDEFEDETGVDTVNSTGETYNSTDDYYKPTPGAEIDYFEYASDGSAQSAYVSNGANAIIISYESSATTMFVGHDGSVNYRYAQKIIVPTSFLCTQIALSLGTPTLGSPGNAIIRIETHGANVPSGTLVHANATWTGTLTQNSWNVIDYTDFTMPSGTYWIVWTHTIPSGVNGWRWAVDLVGGYTGRGVAMSQNGGAWVWQSYTRDLNFRLYTLGLQCYSEASIKNQGSYSLRIEALQTASLNKTLTKSGLSLDLSGVDRLNIDNYALRTGSQYKIGIHDSGGTTTEKTITISSSNTWETTSWDLSGVADADKDDIDSIIITITNADSDNTIYIDNFRSADNNMTLISDTFTAEAEPDTARIVLFEEDVDSITINTDLKAYVSKDGGSTWALVTLSDEGDYESGKRILTGLADLTASGIGSGTSMEYKVETFNNKTSYYHGVGILWD